MTTTGSAWLSSFNTSDQGVATLLIDSLEIHGHAQALNKLRDQLVTAAEHGEVELPAVLIPILSQDELPQLKKGATSHIAYETYHPGKTATVLPGSEGEIGSVIDAALQAMPGRLHGPTLDLETMRELKIKTIVLVTDYCGSGVQARRFVDTFFRNKSIASWHSAGLIQLQVHTYAASPAAEQKLADSPSASLKMHVVAKAATYANWSRSERESIIDLCRRHADPNLNDELPPLGYKESFGLYLTEFRVPNNLPQILIRRGGAWPGLFPNRTVPGTFSSELGSYIPASQLVRTLRNRGGHALATRLDSSSRPVRGIRPIAALYLLDDGVSPEEVRILLELDTTEWASLKSTLIALDLLDAWGQVTPSGHKELERTEMPRRKSPRRQILTDPIEYIPTRLR